MGIRQTLNENPVITAGATGAVIAIALIFILVQLFGSHHSRGARGSGKAFFSDDDGKTWFEDDASKLPPFDHDGKMAYRAIVYKCADGTEFVGRLEKYDEDFKAKMEEQLQKNPKSAPMLQYTAMMSALQVRQPGQTNWLKLMGTSPAEIRKVMQPVCPKDGSAAFLIRAK